MNPIDFEDDEKCKFFASVIKGQVEASCLFAGKLFQKSIEVKMNE